MIEWINPEDRLPEEYHPVLVKIGGDVHVAHIVEKISLTGPGESFWFADDTILFLPLSVEREGPSGVNDPGKPDGWPRFFICAGRQGLSGAIPDPHAYKAKQRRTAVFHAVTPMHRANEKETEHGIYPRIHP